MTLFRQIAAVTSMNLRSLPQRFGTSLVVVVGIAGVVAVLVSVLAMSTGMLRTMSNSGREDRALVLRDGSAAENASALPRPSIRLIAENPAIKRDADGKPIVSAESIRLTILYKKADGAEVNVTLRGVGPKMSALRPEFQIVEGRLFEPGVHEIIVGKAAKAQFKGVEIGDQLRTRGATWTVVGVFTTAGDSHESELLTDAETLIGADGRNSFQGVHVMLSSAAALQQFKDSLSANPALAVDVHRERDYYEQQSRTIGRVIRIVAYVVGGIMAIGAMFGALNTMYSAVSARLREIATLRAIGFGAAAMVMSVLIEALLLALIGGLIGALLAWLFFHGDTVSTSGGSVGGQLIFELNVSTGLVVTGVVWACAIGVLGGLFPAMRAARLPVAAALRAV